MIICINCSAVTKTQLDKLVESGQYASAAQVIEVAVGNLTVLHDRVASGEVVVLDPPANHVLGRGAKERNEPSSILPDSSDQKATTTDDAFPSRTLFVKPAEKPTTLIPMPNDTWGPDQTVPIDRWLFGQYNRLLPAKVNCRVLAHLLKVNPKGIELTKATGLILQAVASFREHLERIDARFELDRDEALATGFPKSDEEKSRLRYANQFVASLNAKGQVSGLLIDLKLINYTQDKAPRILLTEAGWQLAEISNPIVEGSTTRPTSRLTNEEQDFLVGHILHNVPVEAFAYRAILRAIASGATAPESVDKALTATIGSNGESLSAAFLSSQRTGTVARMCDLGLVIRQRDGVRVSYLLTERGKKLI